MTALPLVFRWNRLDRKGQPCRLVCRSRDRLPGEAILPGIVTPAPKAFNSVMLEFGDGMRIVTSGNAIRRRAESP